MGFWLCTDLNFPSGSWDQRDRKAFGCSNIDLPSLYWWAHLVRLVSTVAGKGRRWVPVLMAFSSTACTSLSGLAGREEAVSSVRFNLTVSSDRGIMWYLFDNSLTVQFLCVTRGSSNCLYCFGGLRDLPGQQFMEQEPTPDTGFSFNYLWLPRAALSTHTGYFFFIQIMIFLNFIFDSFIWYQISLWLVHTLSVDPSTGSLLVRSHLFPTHCLKPACPERTLPLCLFHTIQ